MTALSTASTPSTISGRRKPGLRVLRTAAVALLLTALLVPGQGAVAQPRADGAAPDTRPAAAASQVIPLPGAAGAEGIAAGRGSTFFAGDLIRGDIFRGDLRQGTAKKFITAPAGRSAVGMKVDKRHNLLFVAGGPTGQAYVYDAGTGAAVADYQLAQPTADQPAFINDVAVTRAGAWFTNSVRGELYFIPVDREGKTGQARTLELTGPAAETPGMFNLNGIGANRGGRTLIVAHSAKESVYTVDTRTGATARIEGLDLPNVDGIVLRGRTLWAVQNRLNQISRIRLDRGLTAGTVKEVITSPDFQVPTTAALFGNRLAAVNAKFGVPDAKDFEVVVVPARSHGADKERRSRH